MNGRKITLWSRSAVRMKSAKHKQGKLAESVSHETSLRGRFLPHFQVESLREKHELEHCLWVKYKSLNQIIITYNYFSRILEDKFMILLVQIMLQILFIFHA